MSGMTLPAKVKKRDGSLARFDETKITHAIEKAALEVLGNRKRATTVSEHVTDAVLKQLSQKFKSRTPGIEDIQDLVESTLMSEGYGAIAKSYILYRARKTQLRLTKSTLGLRDDLKLPVNTMEVLNNRYLLKDQNRNIIETPSELFRRVAHHVAQAEDSFKSDFPTDHVEETFYQLMRNLDFMPNSPTLMNAGSPVGQLAACFVLPVEDSVEAIFQSLGHMAKIHQSGGGTGFNFSKLRPKFDMVSSTKGRASGPVSFMSIFDQATGVIVQGGRRRGANMGILRCDHPDIIDFVEAKMQPGRFTNFNLSVAVTDNFMQAVKENKDFSLVNPRTAKVTKKMKARDLFDLMANAAWRTGDPGLVFIDEINRHNPTPPLGRIEATNPCGELPLLPYESCTLASMNLAHMVKTDPSRRTQTSSIADKVDWEKLKQTIHWGIRFLDDVLEVNVYPFEQIKSATLANRKIGLGIMGFADMLIKAHLPYDSPHALRFASKLMRFIHNESIAASTALAKQRGAFPNFPKSIYTRKDWTLRNATVNTIAPTGTISIIAGCSSGIEPLFAVSFVRNVLSGTRLFEVHPLFEQMAAEGHLNTTDILAQIAQQGSTRKVRSLPDDMKRIFVTAFDMKPADHLNMQSAFQKYTDNAVSKTINLPADVAAADVRSIFLMAHKLKCKGITVYRYGSREQQVLSFGHSEEMTPGISGWLATAGAEYSGGCVAGTCSF